MSRSDKAVHARNPEWEGPMCHYQMGLVHEQIHRDGPPKVYLVSQDPEHKDVTCAKCLRRLGRGGHKDRMPGQGMVGKKSRDIFEP